MAAATTTSGNENFSPEDYSSFLIREFLKINKMNKTYDMFMEEDKRPKVTMSKSKLTSYLGLESLVRQNQKTKTFATMIDIVSNYLAAM